MKRGPPPIKGFDIALPIALVRGRVMLFQPLPDHVCDFTITGNGIIALVRLMTATRLHASIAEITHEYSGAIAGLSTIPFGGPVSRELWLYSRYGTLRFFRVAEVGLVEIDCHGFLFVSGKPVTELPEIPAANRIPSGPTIPVLSTSMPAAPVAAVPPGSNHYNPKSPIIRWLKKKNAGKNPALGENDLISPINPAFKKDCVHKKSAADRNPVPAIGPVAPVGVSAADRRADISSNGSSVGQPDPLPELGTPGEES